ncbi:MAG: sulfurtransferase TusA family protein [Bacillota bacterium]
MKRRLLCLVGEVCPVPLMRAEEALRELQPGEELVIETDYARAVRNLSHWSHRRGLSCEIEPLPHGLWRVTLRFE